MSNNSTENLNNSQDSKLDRLIVAVQSIDSRLGRLEVKVDQRLHDTQPIWENVQEQLAQVIETQEQQGERLDRLEGEVTGLRGEVMGLRDEVGSLRGEVAGLRADTEKGFRTIDRRMERQIGEFERLHAYQRDLEDRVDRIEKLSNQ